MASTLGPMLYQDPRVRLRHRCVPAEMWLMSSLALSALLEILRFPKSRVARQLKKGLPARERECLCAPRMFGLHYRLMVFALLLMRQIQAMARRPAPTLGGRSSTSGARTRCGTWGRHTPADPGTW